MILITGASSGIGKTLAQQFAKTEKVICVSRSGVDYENCIDIKCDVTDTMSLDAELTKAHGQHGPIRTIIINAGVCHFDKVRNTPLDVNNKMIEVNLQSAITSIQIALQFADKECDIIVMSSVLGSVPIMGQAVYGATKAGLDQFVRTFRKELVDEPLLNDVRITSIVLGSVKTPLLMSQVGQYRDSIDAITPEQVYDVINYTINAPRNICLREIHLSPSKEVIT